MVLKAIETKYFKDREETNRVIKELKTQIQVKVQLSNEKLEAEMSTEIQKLKEKYGRLKFKKEQEIISLDSLEKQELEGVDTKVEYEIKMKSLELEKQGSTLRITPRWISKEWVGYKNSFCKYCGQKLK